MNAIIEFFIRNNVGTNSDVELLDRLKKEPNAYISVIRVEAIRLDTHLAKSVYERGIPTEDIYKSKTLLLQLYRTIRRALMHDKRKHSNGNP